MGFELILPILGAIRELSGIVESWRSEQGLTKAQLVEMARAKDDTLGDFIDAELAMLDKKQQR